jgi:outer membrane protein assembly factor BamD (BamD/ComL family)
MKRIILVLLSVLLLIGMGQLSYSSEEVTLEQMKDALALYADIEGDLNGNQLLGAAFLLTQITKPEIMKELTADEKAQVTMLSSRVEKAKKNLNEEE